MAERRKIIGMVVLGAAVRRLGRRSGVTDAELRSALPGDELVPDPVLVCDRAATFDCAPEELWPWLAQLGKGRGGWYFPAPLRLVTDRVELMRGADEIRGEHQSVVPGDFIPDYGPGEPVFRAEIVQEPRTLVYLTRRDANNNHRWPGEQSPAQRQALALSWGLYLRETSAGRTRLQMRVRCSPSRPWPVPAITTPLLGFVDWLTVALLFPGLRQRLG